MKKIYRHSIENIKDTDVFDNTFLLEYLVMNSTYLSPLPQSLHPREREETHILSPSGGKISVGQIGGVKIIYMRDLLETYKNEEILKRVKEKPAMWSEVYSPKDELEIFTKLFEEAIEKQEKIHIVGITLKEEIEMLEAYYTGLGFMREEINCFEVDFSVPLVTVSCHIENLMWRGSDYKAQRENIFFNPPVRESGQNKALFKGITRGTIAGIDMSGYSSGSPLPQSLPPREREETNILSPSGGKYLSDNEGDRGNNGGEENKEIPESYKEFIGKCIREEKILPLHMGKVLKYNLEDIGLRGEIKELQITY